MGKDGNIGIGARMKNNYEAITKIRLTERMPLIIRLDGKAFHTYTRGLEKPFDYDFMGSMQQVGLELFKEVQNCKLIYGQSDEISLLLVNYGTLVTSSWFANELQKIVSVSASIASSKLTRLYPEKPLAIFDSRAFILPKEEVCNYFIWRQKDAERNSLQGVAQKHYSQKQLHLKKRQDLHDLIHEKGDNWNDYPVKAKRGWCIINEKIDDEIPVFTENRDYINKFVYVGD